jgi:HTH-type transcriptional regulator/antitoxin HigA
MLNGNRPLTGNQPHPIQNTRINPNVQSCRPVGLLGRVHEIEKGNCMNVRTKTTPQSCSSEYLALLRAFPPRPIRDDRENRQAITVVNSLLDRPALTPDEEDYLDVLGLLIADYEDSIYEHPEFTPLERLRHLMEEPALTQADLARRAVVAVTSHSDLLTGKRRISPRVRAKFAECFGILAHVGNWVVA